MHHPDIGQPKSVRHQMRVSAIIFSCNFYRGNPSFLSGGKHAENIWGQLPEFWYSPNHKSTNFSPSHHPTPPTIFWGLACRKDGGLPGFIYPGFVLKSLRIWKNKPDAGKFSFAGIALLAESRGVLATLPSPLKNKKGRGLPRPFF